MAHGDAVVAVACRRHGHAGRAAARRGQDGIGREDDGVCDKKKARLDCHGEVLGTVEHGVADRLGAATGNEAVVSM